MTDAKTAVEEALTPATFNFAEAILDRSYPEIKVPVYLDEAAVQEMLAVGKDRDALEIVIAKSKTNSVQRANQLKELQDKFETAVDRAKGSRYTVTVRGIAPERVIEIEAAANAKFPIEHTESVSPITGATVKEEIPSEDRDEEMAMLIRQAHLVSITAPNGAVDTDFADVEKVRTIVKRLPLVARAKIDEAINECTVQVDFYRELADEVF